MRAKQEVIWTNRQQGKIDRKKRATTISTYQLLATKRMPISFCAGVQSCVVHCGVVDLPPSILVCYGEDDEVYTIPSSFPKSSAPGSPIRPWEQEIMFRTKTQKEITNLCRRLDVGAKGAEPFHPLALTGRSAIPPHFKRRNPSPRLSCDSRAKAREQSFHQHRVIFCNPHTTI